MVARTEGGLGSKRGRKVAGTRVGSRSERKEKKKRGERYRRTSGRPMGQGRARRRQAHRSIQQKPLKHSLRVERGETRPSRGDGEGLDTSRPNKLSNTHVSPTPMRSSAVSPDAENVLWSAGGARQPHAPAPRRFRGRGCVPALGTNLLHHPRVLARAGTRPQVPQPRIPHDFVSILFSTSAPLPLFRVTVLLVTGQWPHWAPRVEALCCARMRAAPACPVSLPVSNRRPLPTSPQQAAWACISTWARCTAAIARHRP